MVVTPAGIVSTIVSMHLYSQQTHQPMCMPANKLRTSVCAMQRNLNTPADTHTPVNISCPS